MPSAEHKSYLDGLGVLTNRDRGAAALHISIASIFSLEKMRNIV